MGEGFVLDLRIAICALPYMDGAYREKIIPFAHKYSASLHYPAAKNPNVDSVATGRWGGHSQMIDAAITNPRLHREFPASRPGFWIARRENIRDHCH